MMNIARDEIEGVSLGAADLTSDQTLEVLWKSRATAVQGIEAQDNRTIRRGCRGAGLQDDTQRSETKTNTNQHAECGSKREHGS